MELFEGGAAAGRRLGFGRDDGSLASVGSALLLVALAPPLLSGGVPLVPSGGSFRAIAAEAAVGVIATAFWGGWG